MNAAAKKLLSTIAAFGDNGGFVKDQPALKQLKAALLVEQHPTATGPVGGDTNVMGVGVKITEAGVAANVAPIVPENPAEKPTFNLVASVPLPQGGKRGSGKGKSIYPFEEMVVGQSFFIPATAAVPKPAKSLASTATSATRRYDEKVYEADGTTPVMEVTKARKGKNGNPDKVAGTRQKTRHTRVYVMRPVTDGAPWGATGVAGAACFRTA